MSRREVDLRAGALRGRGAWRDTPRIGLTLPATPPLRVSRKPVQPPLQQPKPPHPPPQQPAWGNELTSNPGPAPWDLFSPNEGVLGVITSFDDAYTIALDRNVPIIKEKERKAEIVPEEITASTSNNPHTAEEHGAIDGSGLNEENKYSSVIPGQNAYIPLGARGAAGTQTNGNNAPPVPGAESPQAAKPLLPTEANSAAVATTAPSPAAETKPDSTKARAKPKEITRVRSFREYMANQRQRLGQNFRRQFDKPTPKDHVPVLMEDSEKVKQVVEKLHQDAASAKAQEIGAPQVVATISGALLEEGAGTEMPSLNQNEDKAGSQLTLPSSYISVDKQARAQLQNTVVSSLMTSAEIARVLANHGCADLTRQLNPDTCSTYAKANGGFGEVYSGRLMNDTRVAIKVFRLHIVHAHSGKHLKHAARELHTWSKCRHTNVLRLLGLVEFRGQIGMVSPWVENGSVRLYLDRWPNANRYQLCCGISSGLAYLHCASIIHGDLKGANVLVSDEGTPLLTDFGNSVLSDQSLQFTHTTSEPSVSPRWTAPEVLQGLVRSGYSADIFSLGMTLLETMTGNIPYHGLGDPAVYMAIVFTRKIPVRPETHIPTNSNGNNMLWSLLEKCWAFEPEHRPNAEQVRDTMLEIVNLNGSPNIPAAIGSAAP